MNCRPLSLAANSMLFYNLLERLSNFQQEEHARFAYSIISRIHQENLFAHVEEETKSCLSILWQTLF